MSPQVALLAVDGSSCIYFYFRHLTGSETC